MLDSNYKFYKVTYKCGHVGRNHFVKISFPILANSGKEAAKKARDIPRVKHHHKDAIIECEEITYEEFSNLIIINNSDPYLKCENKRQQKMIEDFESRIENEIKKEKIEKKRCVSYKIKKRQVEDNDYSFFDDLDYDVLTFAY